MLNLPYPKEHILCSLHLVIWNLVGYLRSLEQVSYALSKNIEGKSEQALALAYVLYFSLSKLKAVDSIYFYFYFYFYFLHNLSFIFLFLELRVRVRVTRSHCYTSVTLDDMVTRYMEEYRRLWKDDII